ncbi:Ig-like domain-containing protein [Brevibacillus centrosporus]|uniref:Ig-like domain-containing protein n=1 Tax=Brevibacillus centrosporus TaxID=54910 RepID=UPI003B025970
MRFISENYDKISGWGCAINLTQVKVVFSHEVDEASAENESNYTITGLSNSAVSEATLLADGKTVILTLSVAQVQSSSASIAIANVTDEDNKTVETKLGTVTFADTTAPTIAEAKAVGNKAIVVTLSEPVAGLNAADFKLNGQALSIFGGATLSASNGAVNDQPDNQQYTLTFNNVLAAGTYTLTFDSIASRLDAAGFPLADTTKSVTVEGVTTAPVATVAEAKSGTNGTVKVTFDRAMDPATLVAGNFDLNTTGTTATAASVAADNKSVTLTFANVPAGANILLVNPAVEDTYGNNVTTSTNPVRVTFNAGADTTAPALVAATSANDTSVSVKFDEAISSLTANNQDNYVIKDASGTVVAPTSSRSLTPTLVTTGADANKQVNIALGSHLNGGTYTIEVKGIKDATGNVLASASKSFSVTDLRAPLFQDQVTGGGTEAAVFTAATNQVEVFFNEAMQVSGPYSVLEKANWQFAGAALAGHVTLTPGANNKSVIFQFAPTDGVTPGTHTLTLMTAKDVAGNVFATATTSITGAATVNTPVILEGTVQAKAGTSANDIVTFEVDQDLANIAADDFLVTKGGAQVVTNATVAGKVVTLTLANGALGDGTGVTVDVTGTIESVNAAGGALDTETGSALDADDKIAPTVVGAAVTGPRTIEVTFNEALDSSVAGLYKTDWTVDNAGSTIAVASSSSNGAVLTLTIPSNKTLAASDVVVYPAATVAQTKDASGNLFVPTSTQVSSGIDVAAMPLSLASYTAVTLTQTGTVTDGDVQYATAADVIAALPANITVTLEDGSTASVPVTWADTDTYDSSAAASYTFTATWGTLPAGVDNADSVAAPTVEVVVAP